MDGEIGMILERLSSLSYDGPNGKELVDIDIKQLRDFVETVFDHVDRSITVFEEIAGDLLSLNELSD